MFIIIKIKKKIVVILLIIFFISILLVGVKDNIRYIFKISYRSYYNAEISFIDIEYLKNNLELIDLDYNWNEDLIFNNEPNKIIYHHCARSYWSPEGINDYHKERGWKGIGYNFYVRKDGKIYLGRPENAEGAHTKGENSNSIGICLEGNFEEESLSKEQWESLINLSTYITLKYDIYKIVGHRDVYDTLCPGENFPMNEIKNEVIKNIKNYKNTKL